MLKMITLLLVVCTAMFVTSCSENKVEIEDRQALEDKIGQMLMVGFRGFELQEDMTITQDLEERNLGGVILFDHDVPRDIPERNIRDLEQVRSLNSSLQERSDIPLLIAIDQEGGNVARLKTEHGFHEMPSHQKLGDYNDPDSTRRVSAKAAEALADLGFNINYAPVADVNLNPDNPIIGALERSFSADPDRVTEHAQAYIAGHREHGVFSTIKHFPGHGSSEDDTHLGMADVTDTWREVELEPYQNLIETGSVDLIMTAHIFNQHLDPDHPATLSESVITGTLRDEMGYDGVIVSDDMQMDAIAEYYGLEEALELGINAGLDILVFANNSVYEEDITERAISKIINLVEQGRIEKAQIQESYDRIQEFKDQL